MSTFFNSTFWLDLLKSSRSWFISEFPGLLLALALFYLSLKILSFTIRRLKKIMLFISERNGVPDSQESTKRIDTLTAILHGMLRIIVWGIFTMILLQKIGINIAPLLAGAGIIGLAVGFGAQELVRDFISGFFIILEDHIRKGDVAIINGTAGLVEEIGLRTISLRDVSGVTHVFQNGKINTLSNMTKEWSAAIIEISVAYKENLERVFAVMNEVGSTLAEDETYRDLILEPVELMGLEKLADSAMIVKVRIKTKPGEQWQIGREYRKRIKYAFDLHKIEIPFPHTTLYWGEKSHPQEIVSTPQDPFANP